MFLEVVGSDGGKNSESCRLVTMKLGDRVLVDAGSASSLRTSELDRIDLVLTSHAHMDHILELGFVVDSTATSRDTPIRVGGSPACLEAIRAHYMNDVVWPDFSRIRTSHGPAVVYEDLADLEWLDLPGGASTLPVPVNHGAGGRGFLFSSGSGTIVYTGDTGPTFTLWEEAEKRSDVKAVIAEVSFPDSLMDTAIASDHLTPGLLAKELSKFDGLGLPVYAFHLKPWFRQEIDRDLSRQFGDTAVLLMRGDRLVF